MQLIISYGKKRVLFYFRSCYFKNYNANTFIFSPGIHHNFYNKEPQVYYISKGEGEKEQNAAVIIEADKGRISQVISNLLTNAAKFTNEGTIKVTTQKKDSEIVISVKDTGIGIDSEIQAKLFTKFATTSNTGTGLGLFISKSIVESHGGRIWAKNNADGKGATFYFSLPLSK